MQDVLSVDARIDRNTRLCARVVEAPLHESTLSTAAAAWIAAAPAVGPDWKKGLPVLACPDVTLREMRLSDAPMLFAMLTTEEVARFISPPPATVEGFERFIIWAHHERQAGRHACFAVVPKGMKSAIGIFQVRQLDGGFETAEWGFAIGSAFWGTGIFAAGARLVLAFAFDVVAVHRLEARAAVRNGRGNGALRKIGAVCEGVLRRSFLRNSEYLDQYLWSILETDWKARRPAEAAVLH